MSDQTALALADAEARELEQRAVADRLKQQVLDSVADDMPVHIDEYAKALAQKQPAATRALGTEGVSALRAELAEAAERLGALLRVSADKVVWAAHSDGVSAALSQFLGGSHLAPFNNTLRSHGYIIDSTESVSAHDLFTWPRDEIFELEEALRTLSERERAVKAAKRADDAAAVETIWGDSSK